MRTIQACFLGAASILLMTSTAWSDDIFCADKSGKLSVRTACKKGERIVPVNIPGPPGPKGDSGIDGDIGPAGVSGYEIVQAYTPLDTEVGKTATAYCPDGKKVFGGGGHGISADGTTIAASNPQHGVDGLSGGAWTASARYEPAADGFVWRLVVIAICAKVE